MKSFADWTQEIAEANNHEPEPDHSWPVPGAEHQAPRICHVCACDIMPGEHIIVWGARVMAQITVCPFCYTQGHY